MNTINIERKKYKVLDSLEYVSLADSFVKNKIGTGHGEAKLYVGNEGDRIAEFFDDYERESFFLRKDILEYLSNAKEEFLYPQQEYVKKEGMRDKFGKLLKDAESLTDQVLRFKAYRVGVDPPRIYIKSVSEYFELMRDLGLPNISYVSILKIEDDSKMKFYYYKMFIDYSPDVEKYNSPLEVVEVETLEQDENIKPRVKDSIMKARIGQGDYRKKLLEECFICPFTQVNDERLLVASHIKPWSKSNNKEKVDPKNGFLFTPTYDKLFDKGFITFEDDKKLVVSPWISPMNQKRLGLSSGKVIKMLPLDEKRKEYMKYHREKIYKG